MKPSHYAEIAAVVFAAGAAFAIVHRLTGMEYRHFVHAQSVVVDIGLAVIWIAGAVGALKRRSFAAALAVIVATLVMHIHGVMFSISAPGTGAGIPFLLASVALPFLFARSAPAWTASTTTVPRPTAPHRAALGRPSHA